MILESKWMANVDADEATEGHKKRRGGPRRRTGCATCKARHIRCDETRPVCTNCHRLGLKCQASEFISYSSTRKHASSSKKAKQKPQPTREEVEASSHGPGNGAEPSDDSVVFDAERAGRDSGQLSPPLLALTEENVYLLTTYRSGVATWMDVFDFENTYQRDIISTGLTCPLLLRCICAFSAKHLSLQACGAVWQPVAGQYYVEALSLLIKEIDRPEPNANSLTSAILLSSYEVMAALDSPHRSHYQGALDLIRARHVSVASKGMDGKNFRIYVRHELVVAVVNEMPLQLDPNDWQVPELETITSEDEFAMHIMWLAGKATNLVYRDEPGQDRSYLIDDLHSWYVKIPPTFRGIGYGDRAEDGLRKVFFAVPAAAAAMLWYHSTCILLNVERCDAYDFQQGKAQEHIQAILSIGISDPPACVRCFAITPIYIAGKHAHSTTLMFRAWSLLTDIERELGYRTSAMVKALKSKIEQ